ncbi:MAG: tRNA lysidine(34) synthetase TilS [Chloroflexota bacterium]
MQNNLNKLLQTLSQYKLFPLKRQLVVAVSGGADSLALMHWLAQHRAQIAPNLHIATLNHGIRDEADADTHFVSQQAQGLDLPVTVGEVDVPTFASENQLSIETAARQLRYTFLAQVARTIGAQHIATAHHADDQTETILMHIIRGAGIAGLQGMDFATPTPYNEDITLLRPFLTVNRSEVENYCSHHNLKPRHDASNDDTDYTRNKIRHDIVPHLQTINPALNDALLRLSSLARTENDFIETHFQQTCLPHMTLGKRVSISREVFIRWHMALQRRALVYALHHLNGELSYDHVENAIQIAMTGQVGNIVQFTGDIQLRVDYDHLRIEYEADATRNHAYLQITTEKPLSVPGVTQFDDWQLIASRQPITNSHARLIIPPSAKVKIRTRRSGDNFSHLACVENAKALKIGA